MCVPTEDTLRPQHTHVPWFACPLPRPSQDHYTTATPVPRPVQAAVCATVTENGHTGTTYSSKDSNPGRTVCINQHVCLSTAVAVKFAACALRNPRSTLQAFAQHLRNAHESDMLLLDVPYVEILRTKGFNHSTC